MRSRRRRRGRRRKIEKENREADEIVKATNK
jgi:hypothetical protein